MDRIRLFATPLELGGALAADIASRIAAKPGGFLLGCPGGRSPAPVYAALARIAAARRLDLSSLVIVMMDDYVEAVDGGYDHVSGAAHFSCRRFARDDIQAVLNAGLPPAHRITGAHVWFPDPAAPQAYEERLRAAGGIDFFILACGAGDGHVAFNPAGSAAASLTRIVRLAKQTRIDNLQTFPGFADLAAVPRFGVTVGIATITQHARSVAMVVWGDGKRPAYQRLSRATSYDPAWPATVWAACSDATLYADQAAAKGP